MRTINVIFNKTLKLSNVLIRKITNEELEKNMLLVIANQMSDYMKNKGYHQIGPLIQHSNVIKNLSGELELSIQVLMQSNEYINSVDSSYDIKKILRVEDCMYVRFSGEEKDIEYAYNKIGVTAYEEEIELTGDNYTIYINKKDDIITADIFMPKRQS